MAFITIHPQDFKNPLESDQTYDTVILTTVFEHLDDPIFVSNYLLDRLKKGGLFVFDYLISQATGLDTPVGLEKREECLQNILHRTELIYGNIDVSKDVGLCIVKKKK